MGPTWLALNTSEREGQRPRAVAPRFTNCLFVPLQMRHPSEDSILGLNLMSNQLLIPSELVSNPPGDAPFIKRQINNW